MEKIGTPFFFENFENSAPAFYKGGGRGGGSNYMPQWNTG